MKTLAETLNLEENKIYKTTENVLDKITETTDKIYDEIIRSLLPDTIEDNVINIKNALDISKLSEKVMKGTESIFYKNEDIKDVIKSFNIEERADCIIKNIKELFSINDKTLSKSKDTVKDKLGSELTDAVNSYVKSLKKNNEYIEKWKEYYENKDLKNMEKYYKKIEKNLDKLLPLQEEIKKIKEIENITTLIKGKGGDFELTKDELELLKKLI